MERGWVSEVREIRNKYAHQHDLTSEDTLRALDTIKRLLLAVSAREQVKAVAKSHDELMRL